MLVGEFVSDGCRLLGVHHAAVSCNQFKTQFICELRQSSTGAINLLMLFGVIGGDMHADVADTDGHNYFPLNQNCLKYWPESDPITFFTGPTSFGENPSTSGV